MKLIMTGFAILCLVGCHPTKSGESKPLRSEPQFEECIGLTESVIIQQSGSPTMVSTNKAGLMLDELRFPLKSKVENGDVIIKELYYKLEKGERIFWLIQRDSGDWEVFSDVYIPDGVIF